MRNRRCKRCQQDREGGDPDGQAMHRFRHVHRVCDLVKIVAPDETVGANLQRIICGALQN
jgi:hypothetical protein